MSVKYTTSFAFLVFLGLYAFASSLPAKKEEAAGALSPEFEQARSLWSGARKAYKNIQKQLSRRRTRRQAAVTGVATVDDLANITGPYILELYKNLTNESIGATTANTQANTIRSLPPYTRALDPECGEFNFSLSAINSTEFILSAELHLYLSKPAHTKESYVVGIGATLTNGNVIKPGYMRELRATDNDGYTVFQIEDLVRNMISIGQSSAVFNVKVYKDIAEFDKVNPLHCETVKFTYQAYTDITTPILIVYSYNKNIEKINYRDVVSSTILDEYMSESISTTAPTPARRKRAAGQFCGVHDLIIETKHISGAMASSNASDFTILFPTTYDAGICGGKCGGVIPDNSPSNHAPFLFLLLERETFKGHYLENHGYVFEQCCVPVSYKPLVVLTSGDMTTSINTIQDMVIHQCECLDIIKFGTS